MEDGQGGEAAGNQAVVEIKAFVPARDFALSKQFYLDLGFTQASEGGGVAYFHHGNASFLLQDCFVEAHAGNFFMHLLVEDVHAWWRRIDTSGLAEKYGVNVTDPEAQSWGMVDFFLMDPSGVAWRIGQNTPGFVPVGRAS